MPNWPGLLPPLSLWSSNVRSMFASMSAGTSAWYHTKTIFFYQVTRYPLSLQINFQFNSYSLLPLVACINRHSVWSFNWWSLYTCVNITLLNCPPCFYLTLRHCILLERRAALPRCPVNGPLLIPGPRYMFMLSFFCNTMRKLDQALASLRSLNRLSIYHKNEKGM
jgi:hypothetical protein